MAYVPDRIHDIEWLICDAPALLGERGSGFDPSAGNSNRVIVDTGPYHAQRISAIPHVGRARRLTKIWNRLSSRDRLILRARYTHRQQYGVVGAQAVFGQLAAVALAISEDMEALVRALSNPSDSRNATIVNSHKRVTEAAVKSAHKAWLATQEALILESVK